MIRDRIFAEVVIDVTFLIPEDQTSSLPPVTEATTSLLIRPQGPSVALAASQGQARPTCRADPAGDERQSVPGPAASIRADKRTGRIGFEPDEQDGARSIRPTVGAADQNLGLRFGRKGSPAGQGAAGSGETFHQGCSAACRYFWLIRA